MSNSAACQTLRKSLQSRAAVILVVLIGLLIGTTALAQATESPASERQFRSWLAAFNDENGMAIREYAKRNAADQTVHVADDSRFREMTGGFEFKKVEERTSTRVVALLKEKESDTFARITLEVEATAPNKITRFQLLGTEAPAEFRVQPMSERDAIAAVKKVAAGRTESDQFSGAIAIARHGRIVFEQAYGLADRLKKVPNKADTQFRIGSMNKIFTATAILQLDQGGKIKLTDPTGKYLTDHSTYPR